MPHDPFVCIEDAVTACKLIIEFTETMDGAEFYIDLKTKAAVERQFEILGEALNRIKKIDFDILTEVDNWREIIGFRNVIAHGYDVVEDEIVWDSVQRDIPTLLKQLKKIAENP
ncbi:MAG: HepT-like ribonuclease domain-containing protein [Pseudomonadota bacterium]|nr:HepT-like ribonuclease domain-containing protein [Pseudomonadota bacterium]